MLIEITKLKQFDKFTFLGNETIHCIAKLNNCQFTDTKLNKPVYGIQIRTQHGHIFNCYKNDFVDLIKE